MAVGVTRAVVHKAMIEGSVAEKLSRGSNAYCKSERSGVGERPRCSGITFYDTLVSSITSSKGMPGGPSSTEDTLYRAERPCSPTRIKQSESRV